MGITRFHIKKTKIVLVGKYRFTKKEKVDLIAQHTTWAKWNLGIWFRKNKIVGMKQANDPKKWGKNLINDYMLGIDLLIFQGWINWNTGGLTLGIKKGKKEMENVYIYEVVAEKAIESGNVFVGMTQEDMIVEIYKATVETQGKKQAKYYMNIDEDHISDCIEEINERLEK